MLVFAMSLLVSISCIQADLNETVVWFHRSRYDPSSVNRYAFQFSYTYRMVKVEAARNFSCFTLLILT